MQIFTCYSLALLFLLSADAEARPGDLLAGSTEILRRVGVTSTAIVAEDASVYIQGDFASVNGAPRSGVAHLLADGSLDAGFVPQVSAAQGFGNIFSLGGGSSSALLVWPGRGVSVENGSPIFFDATGAKLADVFPLHNYGDIFPCPTTQATTSLTQQYIANGGLIAIVSATPEPCFCPTGEVLQLFGPQYLITRTVLPGGGGSAWHVAATSGRRPLQLLPAMDGGHWLLETENFWGCYLGLFGGGSCWLRKLDAQGLDDPSHPPRSFGADFARLFDTGNGTFAVQSDFYNYYWPTSSTTYAMDFRDANDAPLSSLSLQGAPPFLPEPGGTVVQQEAANRYRPDAANPTQLNSWRQLPDSSADPNFRGPLATQSLLRYADGRILVDGQQRLLPNGAADPSWSKPELLNRGTVRKLWPGLNGTVYALGDFALVEQQPRPGFARFLANGSLDASFHPLVVDDPVIDAVSLADGRLVILRGSVSGQFLQRLETDGTVDATFVPLFDQMVLPPIQSPFGNFSSLTALADGSVLVPSWRPAGDVWQHLLYHVSVTGAVTVVRQDFQYWDQQIYPLPDGRYFNDGKRFLANGQEDTSFQPPSTISGIPLCPVGNDWLFRRQDSRLMLLRQDGSQVSSFQAEALPLWVASASSGADRMIYISGYDMISAPSITRHFPDGRKDPTFRVAQLGRRNEALPLPWSPEGNDVLAPTVAQALLVHPITGELWLGGDFTRVGTEFRSGLARLDAGLPAGFAAWSAAIFQGAAASGSSDDADGDGVSNWREYAAGTDPSVPDAAAADVRIASVNPLCLEVPRNPAAPEIFTLLEVSTDLLSWRSATAAEAVRKSVDGTEAFVLAPTVNHRYYRVRYRSF